MDFSLTSDSPQATRRIGGLLAPLLCPGDVIVLAGDLGAGKTCFTQGLAGGLDCAGQVTSPTFVILHVLDGRLPLYHFDLYRVETAAEFVSLGFEEILYGDGVSVLEWGDRFGSELPAERMELAFHFADETARCIEGRSHGERHERIAKEWVAAC